MIRQYVYIFAFLTGIGSLIGLGLFTFTYGDGLSYLSNNPSSCVNCHVMRSQFDSWQHSSHKLVATCNDCHTPHHPFWKWVTKADNGFFHSMAFTTGMFHEPIRIKPRNLRVAIGACISCHESTVHQMNYNVESEEGKSCIRCHSDVGHGLK